MFSIPEHASLCPKYLVAHVLIATKMQLEFTYRLGSPAGGRDITTGYRNIPVTTSAVALNHLSTSDKPHQFICLCEETSGQLICIFISSCIPEGRHLSDRHCRQLVLVLAK